MYSTLSPYQLLQLSRPHPSTWSSEYDRRITEAKNVQNTEERPHPLSTLPQENMSLSTQQAAPPPHKKTHYIADIHNRHAAALKHLPG